MRSHPISNTTQTLCVCHLLRLIDFQATAGNTSPILHLDAARFMRNNSLNTSAYRFTLPEPHGQPYLSAVLIAIGFEPNTLKEWSGHNPPLTFCRFKKKGNRFDGENLKTIANWFKTQFPRHVFTLFFVKRFGQMVRLANIFALAVAGHAPKIESSIDRLLRQAKLLFLLLQIADAPCRFFDCQLACLRFGKAFRPLYLRLPSD